MTVTFPVLAIIVFLVLAIIAVALLYRLVDNHAHAEQAKIKELRRIVNHLDLIKRSIDFSSGEVIGPVLADMRTDLNVLSKRRTR